MEWKMEKKQKRFEEKKRWIFAKVRAFGPPGYCSCFCLQLAKSCVCESKCACVCKWSVCTHKKRLFFKIVCTFKGLYQFTTAPELMRFRAENKAVHFNSLASGARRPAVHGGATVAGAMCLCQIVYQGCLGKGLQFQLVSLRTGPGWEMRKQSEREQEIIHLFISQ